MTLAKLLAVFLVPLGTLALLLVITAITVLQGRRRLTVLLLLAAVTLVWVTAMPATARRLNAAVESVHVPMAVTQAPAARAMPETTGLTSSRWLGLAAILTCSPLLRARSPPMWYLTSPILPR